MDCRLEGTEITQRLLFYLEVKLSHEEYMRLLHYHADQGNEEVLYRLSIMYLGPETYRATFGGVGGVDKEDMETAFEYMDQYISAYKGNGNNDKNNQLRRSEEEGGITRQEMYVSILSLYGLGLLKMSDIRGLRGLKGIALIEEAGNLGQKEISRSNKDKEIEIREGVKKAIYWNLRGAKLGNVHSGQNAMNLSLIFRSGLVPINTGMAEKWETVAKKLGYNEDEETHWELPRFTKDQARTLMLKFGRKEMTNMSIYVLGTDVNSTCSSPYCNKVEDTAGRRFSVCTGCLQVKYCSPRCQKIHYRAGHKTECKCLKKDKRTLEKSHSNMVFPLVQCFNPKCARIEKDDNENFSRCSRCKHAKYCCRDCQVSHWPDHKEDCKFIATLLHDADKILQDLDNGGKAATN